MIEYYKNLSLENLFYTDENGVLQEEEWRDVPNYVGFYQGSNLGRAKSLERIVNRRLGSNRKVKSRILSQTKSKGYLTVKLSKKGIQVNFQTHVLVAMAFLGHVPCGHELVVNHKNEIKLDNRSKNLEIITMYQNMLYSYRRKATKNNRLLGTNFVKKDKIWVSGITINRKRIYLGRFDTELEASKYYEKALESICNGNENFEIKRNNKIETIQWKNYIT